MTSAQGWAMVLLAGGAAYVLKLAGYLVPRDLLSGRRTSRVLGLLPVALLAALVATQTFTTRQGEAVLDARAVGLAVALVAVRLRTQFLVVIVLAAAATAGVRTLGWAS